MKNLIAVFVVACVYFPALVFAGYGSSGDKDKPSNAAAAFEKLKSLAGTWDTTAPEGGPATITYTVVSNGTTVMETISHKTEPDMITMYTVDGDHIVLTHYCGLGNQPHMRASVPAGDIKELKFSFVDGGNMKKSDMHMHALDMKFIDGTHVQETWSLYDKGKLQNDHAFSLTKKS
jgi:hypothetical protein